MCPRYEAFVVMALTQKLRKRIKAKLNICQKVRYREKTNRYPIRFLQITAAISR
jgi:hypothetical protein